VTYTPDSANRLSAITGATPTDVYANQLQITAFGAISSMRLGNGVTETLSWNDRLQQTGVQASNASAVTLLGLGFYPCPGQQAFCSTGNTGNILSQTIQMPSASFTQNYTYDRFHRLLTAQETGGWWQTNVYDKVGNRALLSGTQYYIPGGSWTPQVPANDPAQVAQMFPGNRWSGATYDGGTAVGAGNVTGLPGTAFGYDAENRLTSISLGATSFEYDGLDQRMKVNSTIYVYDAAGNLAAEYGQGESSLCGTPRCYVTVDHLGSTRLVTDDTGNAMRRYDYLPFGEELPAGAFGRTVERGYQSAPDGFNPKFTGQMRDMVSGLDYFNARYYNPAQGAFLSPDPWNAGASLPDSQSWNGFSYVTNNPLNLVDPSGLQSGFYYSSPPSSNSSWGWSITYGPANPFPSAWGWQGGPNPFFFYGAFPGAPKYQSLDVQQTARIAAGNYPANNGKTCVGRARVLGGNPNTVGKVGGTGVPVAANSAAAIPSQFGFQSGRPFVTQRSLFYSSPYSGITGGRITGRAANFFFDDVNLNAAGFTQSFSGITDVIGSSAVPNVRNFLIQKNPNALILELVNGSDQGVTTVQLTVPGGQACPAGTLDQNVVNGNSFP
jgi:RHS repeat-associated protein